MNLNYLITFVCIAQKQSISAAARELYLTQPGVSKQVQNLEKLYDVELLERHGRGVELTKAGQTFYQHACLILQIVESLTAHLDMQKNDFEEKTAVINQRILGENNSGN